MDEKKPSGSPDLLEFVSNLTGAARFRIEESLPHGYVRLKVAEAERRQAKHDIRSVEDIVIELVRNSRDGFAKDILLGFQREGKRRLLTVLDNGSGIPPDMHSMVFEPRVTSRSEDFEEDRYGVHGRGMALFSIRSRIDDALITASDEGAGTAIAMSVDLQAVPERSDQTTFPEIEQNEDGLKVGNGPHNVPRVMLEMSIDHPEVNFYMGSFSEILATLRVLEGEGAPWTGISSIGDSKEISVAAARLGLQVSERNCYRVLSGEVAPCESIGAGKHGTTARGNTVKKREGPRVSAPRRNPLKAIESKDLESIADEALSSSGEVLQKYYLRPLEARARRGKGRIIITLFVRGCEEDEP